MTPGEAQALGADAISTLLVSEVVAHAVDGLPVSDVPAARATIGDVIEALPPDVVVVAGVGSEVASALSRSHRSVVALAEGTDVPVHPMSEAAFGRGWHDMEPLERPSCCRSTCRTRGRPCPTTGCN